MDAGYDVGPIYDGCEERDCRPIIPLCHTVAVERGDHKSPTCEYGEWRFAGSDSRRGASKWRCPTGECEPASVWIKADRLHPLAPRDSLASPRFIVAGPQLSASSDASRTYGRSLRSASVDWIGSGCTPIWRSSPSSPARSAGSEPSA